MAIGTDDLDFYEEVEEIENFEENDVSDDTLAEEPQSSDDNNNTEDDYLSLLLKDAGIEDRNKIKYENDGGEVEEINWDSLSEEDKYNIVKSSFNNPETGLDDSEVELINAIRHSKMTPLEYINRVRQEGIELFKSESAPKYKVDDYSDDELFIADFISRMEDVTDEEAQEALERAKSNESLFKKLINAIRNEYKAVEEDEIHQREFEENQRAQQRYNQFTNSVISEINNFTEFSGYDLNLEQDDMQTLYDFITGQDASGQNHFAKALRDPKILVQTAWFALNGKQMIEDITDYFQKEITNVRKESYNKGVKDTREKLDGSNKFVYKNKSSNQNNNNYSDLDDF